PVDIIIPHGSMLCPVYPAAVVAGNVETSQAIADALYSALGVLAGSQGTMNNLTFGDGQFQYYETICGGAGAGDGFNGASAVQVHMTNSRMTDPEILELRFPVQLRGFTIRKGSGGTGLHSGGEGVVRRIEFLQSMTCHIVSSHRSQETLGLAGGGKGQTGENLLSRADMSVEELPGVASFRVLKGDVLILKTPGGGGYGGV
ncbi:MAG: hydantoinase B/oxoprolinase family protein, partial [Porticoccaceae bacterium]|nr:hydantoinase B/oxoprolinase family protein [Porticoccaceae bacterium]